MKLEIQNRSRNFFMCKEKLVFMLTKTSLKSTKKLYECFRVPPAKSMTMKNASATSTMAPPAIMSN